MRCAGEGRYAEVAKGAEDAERIGFNAKIARGAKKGTQCRGRGEESIRMGGMLDHASTLSSLGRSHAKATLNSIEGGFTKDTDYLFSELLPLH